MSKSAPVIRRVLMIGLALASLAPAGARAAHWISCGHAWRAPGTTCDFSIRGLPVTVSGWAETASGVARVRVWLTIPTPFGDHTIAECASTGHRYATCSDEFGFGEFVDPFVQSVPVTCHVSGVGSGHFTCASYAGPSG